MYIIVIGAGEVGSHIARIFIEDGHEVAIVEIDEELAQRLDSTLNALVVQGSGVNAAVLKRAGVERADLLLALTSIDEVNLIASMTARKYGKSALRILARVRQSRDVTGEIALSAEDLGLDALISPEEAITTAVLEDLRYAGSGEMRPLAAGRLELVGMDLAPDSPLIHESLASLGEDFPGEFLVVAIQGRRPRIPSGDDRLEAGDRAWVLTRPESLTELAILSGKPWYHVRRVLLVGCGNTGLSVARELVRNGFTVTIIEQDEERAQSVAGLLRNVLVLHADGSDPELLRAEIRERAIDAVVVMLKDPEKSVLIGIFASSLGARKAIVRCDKSAYTDVATRQGVDGLISPKHAMAEMIQRYVRSGTVELTLRLGDRQIEVLQFTLPDPPKNADLIRQPLAELDFPEGALIGAVIRGDQVFIGRGDVVLEGGDEVLVVARQDSLRKVEKLLS